MAAFGLGEGFLVLLAARKGVPARAVRGGRAGGRRHLAAVPGPHPAAAAALAGAADGARHHPGLPVVVRARDRDDRRRPVLRHALPAPADRRGGVRSLPVRHGVRADAPRGADDGGAAAWGCGPRCGRGGVAMRSEPDAVAARPPGRRRGDRCCSSPSRPSSWCRCSGSWRPRSARRTCRRRGPSSGCPIPCRPRGVGAPVHAAAVRALPGQLAARGRGGRAAVAAHGVRGGLRHAPSSPRRCAGRWSSRSVVLLLVPVTALWLTRFLLYAAVGITDTPLALIAPALLGGSPLFVLLYFVGVPTHPAGAHRGGPPGGQSGPIGAWWRVGLPLVVPTTVVVGHARVPAVLGRLHLAHPLPAHGRLGDADRRPAAAAAAGPQRLAGADGGGGGAGGARGAAVRRGQRTVPARRPAGGHVRRAG